jgi:hypothetical protein
VKNEVSFDPGEKNNVSFDPGEQHSQKVYKYLDFAGKVTKKTKPKAQSPKPKAQKLNTRMNSIKSFFQQQHNLRRHPFAAGESAKTTGEPRRATTDKSLWSDLKSFFTKQRHFGPSPFAGMRTSWM